MIHRDRIFTCGHRPGRHAHGTAGRLRWLLALAIGLLLPTALFAFELRVRVLDAKKNPVPDVQVVVMETQKKYYTDPKGEVSVEIPAAGFYTFRTVMPDGTLVQPRLQVQAPGQMVTIFATSPDDQKVPVNQTQSVTAEQGLHITGRREKQNLSRYSVRIDEINRIPGQFGEALRGIENLPGVNAPAFGQGDISLRGANTNANIYLVDDLPIAYPFHVGGLNSVIHNDLIKSIDVYNGAYPANFGNATGGIISIETIDEVKKPGGHLTFSLWSSSALLKGPVQTDGGGYYVASARLSYMDKTLHQFMTRSDARIIPKYGDGQVKVRYDLTPTQSLYVYALASKDSLVASVDQKPSWDPANELPPDLIGASIVFDQAFHTEAIRHVWTPGSKFQSETTLLNYRHILYIDGSIGNYKAKQNNENGYVALRNRSNLEIIQNHIMLEGGLESRIFRHRMTGTTIAQTDPTNLTPSVWDTSKADFRSIPVDDLNTAPYNSAYGMAILKFWRIELKPGFHADHFGLTGQTVVDPKGTAALKITDTTTLTGGAGIYHRTPDPYQFSSSSGNPNLKMEKATQTALGIEQKFKSWSFRVEGFRQIYKDIVVADGYITTPYRLNRDPYAMFTTPFVSNANLNYSNDGDGYSDGYEIYIKKEKRPEDTGWYGWVAYTWSRSIRNDHQYRKYKDDPTYIASANERAILTQVDNAKAIYADFDRRHVLSVITGYKINREWQVGGKWKYMTSQPYTTITGDNGALANNNGRPIFEPVYSDDRNQLRLKPYHRLDVRVDRFFNYEWGYGNFFFEALNLYLRDNPGGVQWDKTQPYSNRNPSISPEFGTLIIPGPKGSGYIIPLFNFGIEVAWQ